MARLALLLVLLIATTAGCNGLADGGTDVGDRDRGNFDVDEPLDSSVSSEGSDAGDDRVPVTDGGRIDDSMVYDAHEAAIRDQGRSQSVHTAISVVDEGGEPVFETEQYMQYDDSAGRFSVHERVTGESPEPIDGRRLPDRAAGEPVAFEFWDGDRTLLRVAPENESVEYQEDPFVPFVPGDWRLRTAFSSVGPVDVDRFETEGRTYYELTADEPAPGSPFLGDEPFSFTAQIREDGLIKGYRMQGTIRDDGELLTVSEAVTVYDVGETSLERPDWYDEAIEAIDDDDSTNEIDWDDEDVDEIEPNDSDDDRAKNATSG